MSPGQQNNSGAIINQLGWTLKCTNFVYNFQGVIKARNL